jgi:hypothetical protein
MPTNLEASEIWKGVLFSLFISTWLTGTLWLISQVPWLGVFAMGVCIGMYMLENWRMKEEAQSLQENICELEKQIVVLKTVLNDMARSKRKNEPEPDPESLEIENRRAGFRLDKSKKHNSSARF